MIRDSRLLVLVCAALVVGPLFAGCLATPDVNESSEGEETKQDAGQEVPGYRWEAPENFTGPLVLRFTFTVKQDSYCEFRAGAAYRRAAGDQVLFWGRSERSAFSSSASGHDVQVHAEDLDVDTREDFDGEGTGAAGFTFGGEHEAGWTDTWTIGSPALSAWSNRVTDELPLFVEMYCEDSRVATSGFGGGHEFKSFREDALEGTGASARGPVGGNAQSDRFFTELESPNVVANVKVSNVARAHVGSLEFHHPKGTQTHLLHSAGTSQIDHHGGAGTYGVQVQRAAVGAFGDFFLGVFAGYESDVEWDDLVTGS